MPLAPRLNTFALAVALLAGFVSTAQAELPTMEFETGSPIHTDVKPLPAPTGHRRPHAGNFPRAARMDAVIRNEEEFDRAFGMCRRC